MAWLDALGFLLALGLGSWAIFRLTAPRWRGTESALDETTHSLSAARRRIAELTRALAEQEGVLQTLGEALMVLDARDRVTWANRAADRLWGPVRLGRHHLETTGSADLDRAVAMARQRAQADPVDITPRHRPERVFEVSVHRLADSDTGSGQLLVVTRDVSRERHLALMRRDFVANVSHELHTPLTAIRGFAETLADEIDPHATPAARYLTLIQTEAERLGRLVDELLELERLESGERPPEIQPVPVRPVVDAVFSAYERRPSHPRLENEVPDDWVVAADPDQLRRILQNLIDNAVRATPETGCVTVRAWAEGGQSILAVRDTGRGIPRHLLPRVFERFFRVDRGRSRAEGGTGLGLAIVRHLTEAHGGRVEVESEEGKGSEFRVRFPDAPLAGRDESAPEEP